MKSMPASSAMRASRRQSGQLADHRSGTVVADRPEEQLAPNRPIFSALALYIARRSDIDDVRASMAFSSAVSRTLSGVIILESGGSSTSQRRSSGLRFRGVKQLLSLSAGKIAGTIGKSACDQTIYT